MRQDQEKHSRDELQPVKDQKAEIYARKISFRNIFCCYCLPGSSNAEKGYLTQSESELRGYGYAATDTDHCSLSVE